MRKGLFQVFIAIFLIGLGVLLFLENIGVTVISGNDIWLFVYPIILIIIGVKWLNDRLNHRGGSWFFGSFLIIFGTLLVLDRFHIISFSFNDIFKLWPLFIIYFGFSFLSSARKSKSREDWQWESTDESNKKQYKNPDVFQDFGSFFSVGNYEYNQPNWKVEPMEIKSMAGNFYFDFTKAFIPEEEIPIYINSLAGDVHILIPENVQFRVRASVIAGEIDIVGQTVDGINRSLQYETSDYVFATQRLDFFIHLKAGSIRVDCV